MLRLVAQTTSTTIEEAPRIVGDPLPLWIWLAAGIALLAVILLTGWWLTKRASAQR